MSNIFQENEPSLNSQQHTNILFGKNTELYKLGLAKSLFSAFLALNFFLNTSCYTLQNVNSEQVETYSQEQIIDSNEISTYRYEFKYAGFDSNSELIKIQLSKTPIYRIQYRDKFLKGRNIDSVGSAILSYSFIIGAFILISLISGDEAEFDTNNFMPLTLGIGTVGLIDISGILLTAIPSFHEEKNVKYAANNNETTILKNYKFMVRNASNSMDLITDGEGYFQVPLSMYNFTENTLNFVSTDTSGSKKITLNDLKKEDFISAKNSINKQNTQKELNKKNLSLKIHDEQIFSEDMLRNNNFTSEKWGNLADIEVLASKNYNYKKFAELLKNPQIILEYKEDAVNYKNLSKIKKLNLINMIVFNHSILSMKGHKGYAVQIMDLINPIEILGDLYFLKNKAYQRGVNLSNYYASDFAERSQYERVIYYFENKHPKSINLNFFKADSESSLALLKTSNLPPEIKEIIRKEMLWRHGEKNLEKIATLSLEIETLNLESNLDEAEKLAKDIPVESEFYNIANKFLLDEKSKLHWKYAYQLATKGKFENAIKEAQKVKKNTSFYELSRNKIIEWNAIIIEKEWKSILDLAQNTRKSLDYSPSFYDIRNYKRLIYQAEKVKNKTKYYNSAQKNLLIWKNELNHFSKKLKLQLLAIENEIKVSFDELLKYATLADDCIGNETSSQSRYQECQFFKQKYKVLLNKTNELFWKYYRNSEEGQFKEMIKRNNYQRIINYYNMHGYKYLPEG